MANTGGAETDNANGVSEVFGLKIAVIIDCFKLFFEGRAQKFWEHESRVHVPVLDAIEFVYFVQIWLLLMISLYFYAL